MEPCPCPFGDIQLYDQQIPTILRLAATQTNEEHNQLIIQAIVLNKLLDKWTQAHISLGIITYVSTKF